MQTVSQNYLDLAAGQHSVEVRVTIGSTTFGEDKLFGVTITGALYNTQRFSIGSCVSREIEVKFLLGSATIPRMAVIQPEIRLVNDEGDTSEWIPKGTFFLDTRELDKESGIMTIRGYDAMLKGEAIYISGLTGTWPKNMTTVASEIASLMGLTMDPRNNLSSSYVMQLPTDYSMREVLGYIAVANCGNWVITDEGKLRLIRVNDTVATVDIGLSAISYNIAEPYEAFTKVEINLSDDTYVESGTDTGRVLVVDCPIVSTSVAQTIANNVLLALSGFIYTPLTADGAIIDPAMEIGDKIRVGTTTSVLATQTMMIDSLCASDISAPGDDELDHEYPYQSVGQRKIERKLSGIEATLYIGPDSIVSRVEAMGDTVDALDDDFSELEQKVDGFTLTVSNGSTTSTIQLKSGSTVISSQTISMTGLVSFTALGSKQSQTFIDGGNIKTGTISADMIDVSDLKVNTVWNRENVPDALIQTSASERGLLTIGLTRNDYAEGDTAVASYREISIYASRLRFLSPYVTNKFNLCVDLHNGLIYPYNLASGVGAWSMGTHSNPFDAIYGIRHYLGFSDMYGTYYYGHLQALSGGLEYIDENGTAHTIV